MATSVQSPTRSDSSHRLATVRRLYFYSIAFITLLVGLASLDSLLAVLAAVWLGDRSAVDVNTGAYVRSAVAKSGGLLLVSTPVFLVHWGYMQRRLTEAGERSAALRKAFLYAASAVALGYTLVNVYALIAGVAQLAFGGQLDASDIWPERWLYHLLMVAAGVGLHRYFHDVLLTDGDYGSEPGLAGVFRRLYQAVVGLGGLALLISGAARILETGWRMLFDLWSNPAVVDWWWISLADGGALLLIGAVVVRVNWQRWLQIVAVAPHEAQTGLRRLYLYAAVVVGAIVTLVPGAALLNETLLLLFGAGAYSSGELLDNLVSPLAYVPVGLAVWLWHARFLAQEARRSADSRESALVGRLYNYAVAATGLALLWIGAVSLLQALLDWFFATNMAGDLAFASQGQIWAEPLANGLSLLAFGVPIWLLHWRAAQDEARRLDEEGLAERASLPRKAYLYGAAFVASLLILFFVAQVVYRVLLVVLGDPNAQVLSPETAAELAASLVAVIVLVIHARAIRQDAQLGASPPREDESMLPNRAVVLQTRIRQLEQELADARAELDQLGEAIGEAPQSAISSQH